MKQTLMTVLISAMLAPVAVSAQAANTPSLAGPTNAGTNQQTGAQRLSAADFVSQATSSNLFEIQSGQLAAERSKNEQVRQFAQRMVKDHTAVAERMNSVAKAQNAPGKMAQRHAQMIEQLGKAEDNQFDGRFLQMQLQAHQEAISLHERFVQNGEAGPLQELAKQTLPTLQSHLQMVQKIGKDVAPEQMAQGVQSQGTNASQIVVQRDAPKIQVEQASPRITVRQTQPEVSVSQPQPELIVHQPAPTITVDIPQPQITVRMPQPDVQVALQRPEVQVEQPQPEVRVQESQKPQVQVQGAQPIASVQGAENQQPKINYQQAEGQPAIRYERAEPKIVVNKAEGQPEVRVERVAGSQQAQQGQQAEQGQQMQQNQLTGQQQSAPARQRVVPPGQAGSQEATSGDQAALQDQDNLRRRFGLGEEAAGTGPDRKAAQTRDLTIDDIEGMDIYNANGEELGEAGSVVQDANNRQFVVITNGGFFGIGEDRAVLPLERFWVQGDRLVAHGVTEQDIKSLGNYREQADNYTEVDNAAKASVGVWQ